FGALDARTNSRTNNSEVLGETSPAIRWRPVHSTGSFVWPLESAPAPEAVSGPPIASEARSPSFGLLVSADIAHHRAVILRRERRALAVLAPGFRRHGADFEPGIMVEHFQAHSAVRDADLGIGR